MIPYCLYCNSPIQDGEELLSIAKRQVIITCDTCNVLYTWKCIPFRSNFKVVDYTIKLNNNIQIYVILNISSSKCVLDFGKQYVDMPFDMIFNSIDYLNNKINNLLPFI